MPVVVLFAIVVLVVALMFVAWLATHDPKPKKLSHDDPLYREMVAFTRKVAYFNETGPTWTVLVPPELAQEARKLLDQEKKELRIRNDS